jgi:hypothetical protein
MTIGSGGAMLAATGLPVGDVMRVAAWVMAVLLFATPAWAGEARTTAHETRLGQHPDLTRLVLDVSESVEFRTLVADGGRRILVGISSVDWETNRHHLRPLGLISRFDFMRRGLRRGLLVIHTNAPVRIERKFSLGPDPADHKGNRLVLDLVAANHPGVVAAPKGRP